MTDIPITIQILERLLSEKIMATEVWNISNREAKSLGLTDNLEFRVAADIRETQTRMLMDKAEAAYNAAIERYVQENAK